MQRNGSNTKQIFVRKITEKKKKIEREKEK